MTELSGYPSLAMMIASLRSLLPVFFLVCTLLLYTRDHFLASFIDAQPTTSEAVTVDLQSSTPPNASSSNICSTPTDIVHETANRTSNVSKGRRPKILQATMMFGDKYLGLNERTLRSHTEHAKRWGYENHILRREIVGAGQWDKFIFSKILLLLKLIIKELERPREERAEWVV